MNLIYDSKRKLNNNIFMECEYMKIIYLNNGLNNEDVSDHRSYDHCMSSSENKAWT